MDIGLVDEVREVVAVDRISREAAQRRRFRDDQVVRLIVECVGTDTLHEAGQAISRSAGVNRADLDREPDEGPLPVLDVDHVPDRQGCWSEP